MEKILKKIDEAVASDKTSEENKKLLLEIKEELLNAKSENKSELEILKIITLLIKIITDFF
ncbi:hypothetical protein [Flavobacterium sp.]|uniref:hypothetical protein n=1 Tax=Flavobacterium sp. TaxID=239 RepID=UPI00262D09DA|nr:hypothetical protein [Flavobacterium sp.]